MDLNINAGRSSVAKNVPEKGSILLVVLRPGYLLREAKWATEAGCNIY
jgi:hypothetical protein